MGAKERFKTQFRFSTDYFALRHEDASDFYLSCWQSNRSAVPLFCVRILLFLGSLGILVTSLVLTAQIGLLGYWAIYMTQWALVTIVVVTGLACAVSAVACFKGPIQSTFGLPWYDVRVYYCSYVVSLPLAFYVTIFYYSFLTDAAPEDYEVNPVLDVLIHAINSVVLFLLMVTSRSPFYFLQLVYPLALLLIYMTFSIIYYFAGGTNPFGEHTIYPPLDWADPGPTVGLIFICLALSLATSLFATLLTMLRDCLSRNWSSRDTYNLG